MRELLSMAAMAAFRAMRSAGDVVIQVGDDPDGYTGDRREPTPARAPAARALTEADNTRLRMAAERRLRKALRQAKGLAPPATSDPSDGALGRQGKETLDGH